MTLFFMLLLGASALFFTLEPLFRWREIAASTRNSSSEQYEELLAEKETIYLALKEIEFDHSIGKLSQEDYLDLKHQYEEKAIRVLRALDEFSPVTSIADEIEREIAALRQQQSLRGEGNSSSAVLHCPHCQKSVPADARFCAQCGTALLEPCPQCGKPYHREDQFCAYCGQKL